VGELVELLNSAAPDFTLESDSSEPITLSSLRGKVVVLYFYPKDDTTGCTKEACAFRDLFPRFKRSEAVIIGVSPDSVSKHKKFKVKYSLPFTLLADVDHKVAEKYGIWVEKTFYGRKYMGVERTTYIIGPDGKIKTIFSKVNPDGHAEAVHAALKSLK
jgi:peroxiredoxin Q/BCP